MRAWFGSSSGGFVAVRTRPFASGFSSCSSARFTTISTLGRRKRVLGWRSLLCWISFPVQYFETQRAHSHRILALEGIEIGHYAALETPWEKTFFFMPLGHSEDFSHLETAIQLAEELV